METTYKILIVDDSEPIHKTIRHMLKHAENLKSSVFSAYNGQQAYDIAVLEHPDIILMDIEMPEMNGIEATKLLKSEPSICETPILLMSSTRSFAEAFAAGADDFILKPFNQYELLLRVSLNIKFAQKDKEIKQKTELLNLQNQEVICQRDQIAAQQNVMMKDLQYASYIQCAIMPEIVHLEEYLKSFFIYNRPKDIVSGDFYWATKKSNQVIIAVGDCTGHGIAGALMTMAGGLLNF
jgi:sigma-B regulation protein RsbU (phosphoserine phosphatase)